MVGGGIFAVLGVAATDAGGATPLAFLIGGAIAAVTAYSYSKLSVANPSPGGTVTFVDGAFGVSELTGSLNALLWVGYVATTALYASAFGHYAATLLPGGTSPPSTLLRALIFVAVFLPWLVNLGNAAIIARAEGAIVVTKLVILGVVIAAGVPSVSGAMLSPPTWPGPLAIVAAGMLIFVAYEGFELIANASRDVRDPNRTLPRAYALSVGLVVVLYVLIAVVVVGTLTPAEIARTADFALAQAASSTLGSAGFRLVAVSAMLATLSAINATLYGAARLSYTLATEGELPERFTHVRWHDPVGLHLTAGLGIAIAVALPLASISAVASAIFLMVFATVNSAAARYTTTARANRILAAAGAAACIVAVVVLLVRTAQHDRAALITLILLTAMVLTVERRVLARRRRHFRPASADDSHA